MDNSNIICSICRRWKVMPLWHGTVFVCPDASEHNVKIRTITSNKSKPEGIVEMAEEKA